MKPILFNTEMVKAIQEGRKTVTRRLVKPQPVKDGRLWRLDGAAWTDNLDSVIPVPCHGLYNKAPFHPGDILYVRETWGYNRDMWLFKANYREDEWPLFRWHPSIHMPKKIARLFLRVTDVRLERLQYMDGEQAYMEGAIAEVPPILEAFENRDKGIFPKNFEKFSESKKEDWYRGTATATYIARCELADRLLKAFKKIWNKTIKRVEIDEYGWDANPWVWVIKFEKISKEEATKC